ncbi:MAG: tRNA epoxyqueuosine(34) reductase QueG [Gammaproteobacteria bacterium]|nr:tRNA epoxyqueuosine(34) reductase QueG [Gammaproteobacteria bacterium]
MPNTPQQTPSQSPPLEEASATADKTVSPPIDESLASRIKAWGIALGFADVGITHADLSEYEANYFNWIGQDFHGDMEYMVRHGTKRTRPNLLEPGTQSIISVRMNYFDTQSSSAIEQLHQDQQGYVSRYALGKDYHKLLRKRLQQLAEKIADEVEGFQYRAFTDSAPVLERPIAQQAGLGFIGKNSLIIHPRAGSWFFLGELYTNLALPADVPFSKQGCGPCTACLDECPTQAIVDNQVVDARRCISYLTIEYKGSIPEDLRALIGNRIYGCDDCQLVCPWNKFTEDTLEVAFRVDSQAMPLINTLQNSTQVSASTKIKKTGHQAKHKSGNQLDQQSLLSLWHWTEADFLKKLEGSPIRRIGYAQWCRNLAVSIGNVHSADGETLMQLISALQSKQNVINDLVDEHIIWAVNRLQIQLDSAEKFETTRPGQTEQTETNASKKTRLNTLKPFIAPKYYQPKNKS